MEGKKINKEKSLIQIIALLDSRQALISKGSFSRDWGLYISSWDTVMQSVSTLPLPLCRSLTAR